MHPKWDRGGGQRRTDRSIAALRKSPVEPCAQIVDFGPVFGQPLSPSPHFRCGLGALEKIAVILGVTVRESFALAVRVKLLDCVGAGRVEQSEPRFGAA